MSEQCALAGQRRKPSARGPVFDPWGYCIDCNHLDDAHGKSGPEYDSCACCEEWSP